MRIVPLSVEARVSGDPPESLVLVVSIVAPINAPSVARSENLILGILQPPLHSNQDSEAESRSQSSHSRTRLARSGQSYHSTAVNRHHATRRRSNRSGVLLQWRRMLALKRRNRCPKI
jgi:hypothetical protein